MNTVLAKLVLFERQLRTRQHFNSTLCVKCGSIESSQFETLKSRVNTVDGVRIGIYS